MASGVLELQRRAHPCLQVGVRTVLTGPLHSVHWGVASTTEANIRPAVTLLQRLGLTGRVLRPVCQPLCAKQKSKPADVKVSRTSCSSSIACLLHTV